MGTASGELAGGWGHVRLPRLLLAEQHFLSPPPRTCWEAPAGSPRTMIACDGRRPPRDGAALPRESPGYCGEHSITQVCFPRGATLPRGLICNFYVLIKNRSNGGGSLGGNALQTGSRPHSFKYAKLPGPQECRWHRCGPWAGGGGAPGCQGHRQLRRLQPSGERR